MFRNGAAGYQIYDTVRLAMQQTEENNEDDDDDVNGDEDVERGESTSNGVGSDPLINLSFTILILSTILSVVVSTTVFSKLPTG